MEKHITFLSKLATYNRYIVAENGHIVTRNGPTIGVVEIYVHFWPNYSPTKGCSGDKWSGYE